MDDLMLNKWRKRNEAQLAEHPAPEPSDEPAEPKSETISEAIDGLVNRTGGADHVGWV